MSGGRRLLLAAGLGEIATGLLLIAAPGFVAESIARERPPLGAEPFLGWVGVFVLAIGFMALDGGARPTRSRPAAVWTAGARLLVALYVGAAVATGTLPAGWAVVAIYDALLAAAQAALVARGAFGP